MGRTEDVHSGRSYKSGQEREEGGVKGREDVSEVQTESDWFPALFLLHAVP